MHGVERVVESEFPTMNAENVENVVMQRNLEVFFVEEHRSSFTSVPGFPPSTFSYYRFSDEIEF